MVIKAYKSKEERKALYENLLANVNVPLQGYEQHRPFICWKLWVEVNGIENFGKHRDYCAEVVGLFPEFDKAFRTIEPLQDVLRQEQRPLVLRSAIELCEK